MSKKKFLKGKTNKFNKEERKMNIMEQHKAFYSYTSEDEKKKEIERKIDEVRKKIRTDLDKVLFEDIDSIRNLTEKVLINKILSPLYKEAQGSNEFKLEIEELLKNLKNKKDEESKFILNILTKDVGYITDREICIFRTLVLITIQLEELLQSWNNWGKDKKFLKLRDTLYRYDKIDLVARCLGKYFAKVNELEEYVQLRIDLYEIINTLRKTITFISGDYEGNIF